MASQEPFPFASLIPNLQCEVFSTPISLTEYNSYKLVSKEIQQQVQQCIKELYIDDDTEGQLTASMVLNMPNLEIIDDRIHIIVDIVEELDSLAQHNKLRYAVFDITSLVERDPRQGYVLVNDFFNQYINRQKAAACNDCLGRYSFIFTYSGKYIANPFGEVYNPIGSFTSNIFRTTEQSIEVSEGSLRMLGTSQLQEVDIVDFLTDLSFQVPICHWEGSLSYNALQLAILPCLHSVHFVFDEYYISINPDGMYNVITPLLGIETITSYDISYNPIDWDYAGDWDTEPITYIETISSFVMKLAEDKEIYPHVESFLPVKWQDVETLARIMPNLTSINISLESLIEEPVDLEDNSPFNRFLNQVSNYTSINLYNDTLQQQDLPVFPSFLQDRIRIIPANM